MYACPKAAQTKSVRKTQNFWKGVEWMNNLNDLLAKDNKAKQFFLSLPEDAQGALIQSTYQIHNADELYFHAQQAMGKKK